ncbi:MAG: hypothetical protein WBD36_15435 [Bacteroidota bacterium]
MTTRFNHMYCALVLGLFAGIGIAPAQSTHREISRSKEKELSVFVDVSFGSLVLERGEKGKIEIIDFEDENEEDNNKLSIDYGISDDEGTLRIRLKKKSSRFWDDDDDSDHNHSNRKLTLKFSNALPISFDLELGAGRGDIDLSGLQVNDLKVSTGASSVTMRCDEPNPISAESIKIESGVSKFSATNLCNTNFRRMKFSGGVGTYKLDFGGKLRRDADVKIEVGLGSVAVYLPKDLATRVLYDDNWFSSFDLDREFSKERNGVYVSDDYSEKGTKLTIQIESGLGSVKVKRK